MAKMTTLASARTLKGRMGVGSVARTDAPRNPDSSTAVCRMHSTGGPADRRNVICGRQVA